VKLIVFEGINGCGKSTIAEMVARKMEAVLYRKPQPEVFSSVRNTVDAQACVRARYLFYLAVCAQASHEIAELLKKTDVVCDRYILSTICYFSAMGVQITLQDEQVVEVNSDYTFLITCERREAERRARERGKLSFTDHEEKQKGLYEKIVTEYRKHDIIEIDNSAQTPLAAVHRIVEILKGMNYATSRQG